MTPTLRGLWKVSVTSFPAISSVVGREIVQRLVHLDDHTLGEMGRASLYHCRYRKPVEKRNRLDRYCSRSNPDEDLMLVIVTGRSPCGQY